MGSHISFYRRMNSINVESDSDSDRDIATVLQYLIRSGQVRFVRPNTGGIYEDVSDDDIFDTSSPPNGIYVENNPDTSQMQGSDIYQNIMLNSGSWNSKNLKLGSSTPKTLLHPLLMRESGMNGRSQFTRGDRCQIYQRFLPNKMKPLDRYQNKVFCGTFSRNGDVFMTAAQDYFIRLYDSHSSQFKLIKMVEARDVGWSVLDTAVSPDGCYFVYCSWSDTVHICNVFGEQEIHDALAFCPNERRFCVFALRFSQDGREILGGANDECLYVYDRYARQRTLKIHAHEDDVNTVAFADSSSHILFSGGDDGLCKVWDRRTLCESDPKPVGVLIGHEDGITFVDSKGDGRHLITNSKDQSIKLWDMRKFSPNSSLDASRQAVQSHNWDYRWQRVPSRFSRPKKKLDGDTSLMTYRGHSVVQTLIRCHFSPEATTGQRYIYTGCAQGRIVIYDVLTGKIKTILSGHKTCVRDVAWHPYRNEIMSSSWDGTVAKWTFCGKCELDSDEESDCSSDEYHLHPMTLRSSTRRERHRSTNRYTRTTKREQSNNQRRNNSSEGT